MTTTGVTGVTDVLDTGPKVIHSEHAELCSVVGMDAQGREPLDAHQVVLPSRDLLCGYRDVDQVYAGPHPRDGGLVLSVAEPRPLPGVGTFRPRPSRTTATAGALSCPPVPTPSRVRRAEGRKSGERPPPPRESAEPGTLFTPSACGRTSHDTARTPPRALRVTPSTNQRTPHPRIPGMPRRIPPRPDQIDLRLDELSRLRKANT